jgi:YHS domain-containing protein
VILVEVVSPRGALAADDRVALARDVCDVLVGANKGVAEETMRRARAMTHVGFHELAAWTTGDGPWEPDTAPPLWITLTVPEAWREEISRTVIGLVRRGVRRLDRSHGWERADSSLWVNVVGISNGSIGLGGKAQTADDDVAYMTAEFRARHEPSESPDLPDGVVIDPMCGMQVRLDARAFTLEHDGRTLGFCAAACRAAYAREHGLSLRAIR